MIVTGKLSPKITLLTPVWNGLPYIKEAIGSVLAQSFGDWEWVIGDNGSTDGTVEYLHALNDPRIHVWTHEHNKGIFGNLNFLFAQANAPITQILCADDYLSPDSLEYLVGLWHSLPEEIGVLRSNWSGLHDELLPANSLGQSSIYKLRCADAPLAFYVYGCLPGNLTNVSVKTECVRELGGFDERLPYAGDYEFWSRLSQQRALAFTNARLSYVRRHAGVASIYLNKKGELILQRALILNNLFKSLETMGREWRLILHGCIAFDSLLRDQALKTLWATGVATPLQHLDSIDARFLPTRAVRELIYWFTLGGRVGLAWSERLVRAAYDLEIPQLQAEGPRNLR